MTILYFIALLVVLIWVHELGHFAAAKLFRIRVDEFNIGFGPSIASFTDGQTRYGIKPLILGGYVSLDEASLAQRSRPVQAAVVLAGIAANLLFAWLLLSAGYLHGLPSAVEHDGYGVVTNARPTIEAVVPGSPAEKSGVLAGDIVTGVATAHEEIDFRTFNTDRQAQAVHDFLTAHADESVVLHLDRNGQPKDFVVRAAEGVVDGRKAVGVQLNDIGVLKLPLQLALLQGAYVGWQIFGAEAQGLGDFVTRAFRGSANVGELSGPIGIVAVGSQFVAQGWAGVINITAIISLNLALINIIPIPGLDGGRLLFIAIEGILRRPISPKLATGLTIAGFVLLVTLMIVVSFHDIARLIG
ncbi:MAG: site-2 protease family protein [Patescibacteria group bacterium]